MEPLYNLLQLSLTEKVILKLRRHWFIFFKNLLIFILEALIPVVIYFLLTNFWPDILANPTNATILFLVVTLYYLFIWVTLFYHWINYYLDIWVITDKQVICVQQNGIFNRTVSRQQLYRIQDVMAKSKGVWPTILRFGDVKIQSAGAEEHFLLEQVPNPFEVETKIENLVKYSPKDVLKNN